MRKITTLLKSFFNINDSGHEFGNEAFDIERPEFSENCIDLIKKAHNYLTEQQKHVEEIYQLSSYQKWYYDQVSGKLTFSDDGVVKLAIDYEEVGSISKISNTWLWAWGNEYIEKNVKTEIVKVRQFGIDHAFEPLTKSKWKGDEFDGWEMTAVAALVLNSEGAYRVPTDNTFSFMIFKNITDLR